MTVKDLAELVDWIDTITEEEYDDFLEDLFEYVYDDPEQQDN